MVIDKIAFLERKLAEAEGEDNDGYLQGVHPPKPRKKKTD